MALTPAVLTLAWFLFGAMLGPSTDVANVDLGPFTAVLVASLAGFFAAVAAANGRWAARRAGRLEVTAQALTVDGVSVVKRLSIRQAVQTVTAAGVVVRVTRKHGLPVDMELASKEDAHALLAALSQDGGHATASFSAWTKGPRDSLYQGLTMLACAALALIVGELVRRAFATPQHVFGFASLLAAPLLPLSVVLPTRLWKRTLVVGVDGILVKTPWRSSVFLPFGAIGDVRREGGDVLLTLASGKAHRFGFVTSGDPLFESRQQTLTAFLTRVADARALFLAGESSSDLASALARGHRDVASWRASLELLVSAAPTYRTSTTTPERLWRVLEDPTQPATARAGAAVALRRTIDEGGRGRLRVASAACASADLRGLLEAAAEEEGGSDAKVERAMASLGAESR